MKLAHSINNFEATLVPIRCVLFILQENIFITGWDGLQHSPLDLRPILITFNSMLFARRLALCKRLLVMITHRTGASSGSVFGYVHPLLQLD